MKFVGYLIAGIWAVVYFNIPDGIVPTWVALLFMSCWLLVPIGMLIAYVEVFQNKVTASESVGVKILYWCVIFLLPAGVLGWMQILESLTHLLT